MERCDCAQHGIHRDRGALRSVHRSHFKPMTGREDASGGIVLRFAAGLYDVMWANALENNFCLYAYDCGRHRWATARV